MLFKYVTNHILQVAIEIKRFLVKRSEEHANQVAIAALRQMEQASKRLECDQSTVIPALPVVKLAWQEDFQNPVDNNNGDNNKRFVEKAVKFGRIVSMFGIFPAFLFAVAASLENIDSLRPHGTTGLMMFVSGVLYPFMFILYKPKLRKFTFDLLNQNCICIKYNS